MSDYKTIAESRNFIVLDKYTKELQVNEGYQSEGELEREFSQIVAFVEKFKGVGGQL